MKSTINMKILVCDCCSNNFKVHYNSWKNRRSRKKNFGIGIYCSSICRLKSRGFFPKIKVKCLNCEMLFEKHAKEIKKTSNNFCSRSCSATYNNTHKSKGTRRSKLEKWLEKQLFILYPDLEVIYSSKNVIDSELDIYIPSLKLAFEINGLFHYEPIFGEDKLNQIQENDNKKLQACAENKIELYVINTSQQKYFKESTSIKYLNFITHLVTSKLEASKTDYVEVV
jgi:hypothetical protein